MVLLPFIAFGVIRSSGFFTTFADDDDLLIAGASVDFDLLLLLLLLLLLRRWRRDILSFTDTGFASFEEQTVLLFTPFTHLALSLALLFADHSL